MPWGCELSRERWERYKEGGKGEGRKGAKGKGMEDRKIWMGKENKKMVGGGRVPKGGAKR